MSADDPQRMFIDVDPPEEAVLGDVWIRRGEVRVLRNSGWDPPWLPPLATSGVAPAGYPQSGRRKKVKHGRSDSQGC